MNKIHLCYPVNGKSVICCKNYEEYRVAIKLIEYDPISKHELNSLSIPHTNIAAIEVVE